MFGTLVELAPKTFRMALSLMFTNPIEVGLKQGSTANITTLPEEAWNRLPNTPPLTFTFTACFGVGNSKIFPPLDVHLNGQIVLATNPEPVCSLSH